MRFLHTSYSDIPVRAMRSDGVFFLYSMVSAITDDTPAAVGEARSYTRERVLFFSVLLLLLLLVFTAFAARLYHKQIHVLADQWFAQGEAMFKAGNIAEALRDYRNGLVYAPDNRGFQFHLAQALAAAGRSEEARSYLLNLLSETPGSGPVNLELARIAARQGSMQDALRYYHGAIFGVWDIDPIAMRWQIRRELCEYVLAHGSASQAEEEVVALAVNTPSQDLPGLLEAGKFLLRAQLWPRALNEFQLVLAAEPRNTKALAGAGTAAFRLGQYSESLQYLSRLPADQRAAPAIAEMIATSRGILAADPYLPGLSAAEKARRATRAVAQAESRAAACAEMKGEPLAATPPASALEETFASRQEQRLNWRERNLEMHPERLDSAMAWVFKVEDLTASQCGPPQGEDGVLSLIEKIHSGRNP